MRNGGERKDGKRGRDEEGREGRGEGEGGKGRRYVKVGKKGTWERGGGRVQEYQEITRYFLEIPKVWNPGVSRLLLRPIHSRLTTASLSLCASLTFPHFYTAARHAVGPSLASELSRERTGC